VLAAECALDVVFWGLNMTRRDQPQDSLDRETTRSGEPSDAEAAKPSLGDLSTFGDAGASSVIDVGEISVEAEDELEVVDLSTRFAIEGVVGRGGMGKVFKAVDRRLNRTVAIKRLRGEIVRSRKMLQRFWTEARSVAALNHFNIVQVYDYGRDADGPFLILEYVDGESLADRLKRGPLPWREAVEIACHVCDALSFAHKKGIVHRDVKPGNILLTRQGEPKLVDFGLVHWEQADQGHTLAGEVLGTPDFMSPEQRRDASQADARSDLWGLAASLYQMVTGEIPRVIDLEAVAEPIRPILGKALKTRPDDRYRLLDEFRDALRQATVETTSLVAASKTLKGGQCAACSHSNDPKQKFCTACGASLRQLCAACGATLGIWEQFCGECGENLQEALVTRRKVVEDQKGCVEALRREYRHREALDLLRGLPSLDHPQLASFRQWADTEVAELEREEPELRAKWDQLVEEGQKLLDSHCFGDALRVLEQIPESVRDNRLVDMLRSASDSLDEADDLLAEIRQRLAAEQLDGLLVKVQRYLELRPANRSIEHLRGQLQKREDRRQQRLRKHLVRAQKLFESFNDAAVIDLIGKLTPKLSGELLLDTEALEHQARSRLDRVRELTVKIGGAIQLGQSEELLPNVEEFLTLRPSHKKMLELRETLQQEDEATRQRRRWIRIGAPVAVAVVVIVAWGLSQFTAGPRPEQTIVKVEEFSTHRVISPVPILPTSKHTLVGKKVAEVRHDKEVNPKPANQLPVREPPPPSLIAPFDEAGAKAAQKKWAAYLKTPVELTNSIGMKLILIPPGEFMMGSDDHRLPEDVRPVHRVRITKPLYFGVYEVTQEEFERVTSSNPSHFRDDPRFPVESVSGDEMLDFLRKLSGMQGEKGVGRQYRLPTEAEWEDACRAGSKTLFHFGDAMSSNEANFNGMTERQDESRGPNLQRTTKVGSYAPNAFGLYDMHGNVTEAVTDFYSADYYTTSPVNDPQGPDSGELGIGRGGSWNAPAVPSAYREKGPRTTVESGVGFRVVCEIPLPATPEPGGGSQKLGSPSEKSDANPAAKKPDSLILPFDQATGRKAQEAWAAFFKQPIELTNSIGTKLMIIPAGEFMMGAGDGEEGAADDEKPQHRVRLTKSFYLGTYEVTQAEYERVIGRNPSKFSAGGEFSNAVSGQDTSRFPAENVSWYETVEFCNKLSEREKCEPFYQITDVEPNDDGSIKSASVTARSGTGYRLPTEAEWEYACRAGTTTPFHFGSSLNGTLANSDGNHPYGTSETGSFLERTTTVGSYKPNAFGLYDMHGNVRELCWDWHDKEYYARSPETDPTGPALGSDRVYRGGCFIQKGPDGDCRSAARDCREPTFRSNRTGFRVARNCEESHNGQSADPSPRPNSPIAANEPDPPASAPPDTPTAESGDNAVGDAKPAATNPTAKRTLSHPQKKPKKKRTQKTVGSKFRRSLVGKYLIEIVHVRSGFQKSLDIELREDGTIGGTDGKWSVNGDDIDINIPQQHFYSWEQLDDGSFVGLMTEENGNTWRFKLTRRP
jgi:formylglycine-generating enzyme required for sulfatase activity/serine/threonine protein kinase